MASGWAISSRISSTVEARALGKTIDAIYGVTTFRETEEELREDLADA
jgi:hypothetical protein